MAHHCHAIGCDDPCPPERLMCGRHWRLVPADIKAAVREHYRHGQCRDMSLVTREWLWAAERAKAAVLLAEGGTTKELHDAYLELRRKHLAQAFGEG